MNKILTIFLTCSLTPVCGQFFLNLGFEYETPGSQLPGKWNFVDQGYAINLDTIEHVSYGKSLRVHSNKFTAGAFGVCAMNFPLSLAKGKRIEFKGKGENGPC
jgi:hypothetical protein